MLFFSVFEGKRIFTVFCDTLLSDFDDDCHFESTTSEDILAVSCNDVKGRSYAEKREFHNLPKIVKCVDLVNT